MKSVNQLCITEERRLLRDTKRGRERERESEEKEREKEKKKFAIELVFAVKTEEKVSAIVKSVHV